MLRLPPCLRSRSAGASRSPALVLSIAALALAAVPAPGSSRPGLIVFASHRGGQSDLWLMQADGSSPTNLTSDKAADDFPAWSADGRRIAWTRGGPGPEGEIWVMADDGSNAHQVTFDKFPDLQPTWSPDGSRIAFCSIRHDNRDIYVIDADGRNERRLTTDPASDYAPDWSPVGGRIAWTSARSGHQAVYTMNVDGSDVRQVTPDSLEGGLPGWSPDGRRILFSDALCETCSESDLWMVNADGSGLTQITDTPTNELAKSWSLDGKSVVGEFTPVPASEKHAAKGGIAAWDVATGAMTMLTNGDASLDQHPDWSPVGRAWVFPHWSAVRVDSASGVHEPHPAEAAPWSRLGGGAASIEYDLPKAGHVRVRVFDQAGHEVARPVDEWQAAGRHQAMFAFGAARNQEFVYRVECGGRRTSGRISTGP